MFRISSLVHLLTCLICILLLVPLAAQDAEDADTSSTAAAGTASPEEVDAPESVAGDASDEAAPPAASGNGVLLGTVFDSATGDPQRRAAVTAISKADESKTYVDVTDLEGRFRIEDIPAGLYLVTIFKSDYRGYEVEDLKIVAGDTAKLRIPIERVAGADEEDAFLLEPIVVTPDEVNENSFAGLQQLRQSSVASLNALSSDQISRSGASDVADALTKLPGVTISGGKYAVIRGLNDRYSTTQLNGITLTSPDPDRQAVQLDIFPTGLVESIVTAKTFTPDLPGESTGGSVNVKTKSFPEEPVLKLKGGMGWKEDATGDADFLDNAGFAEDLWANGAQERSLRAVTNGKSTPFFGQRGDADYNYSFGFEAGNSYNVFKDGKVGAFGGFTYSNGHSYRRTEFQRFDQFDPDSGLVRKNRAGIKETGEQNILLSTLIGTAFQPNDDHQFIYNLFYTRAADDETSRSVFEENDRSGQERIGASVTYVQREFIAHQLEGSHNFPELGDFTAKWALGLSSSEQDEPLTRTFNRADPFPNGFLISKSTNVPTLYERFTEQENEFFRLDFEKPGTLFERDFKLSTGLAYEKSERDFRQLEARSVNDPVFASENLNDLWTQLVGASPVETGNGDGNREVFSYYGMIEFNPLEKIRVIGGFRVEATQLSYEGSGTVTQVNFNPPEDLIEIRPIDQTDFLPSVTIVHEINDNSNLRFAYSKTIAKPSFRELSPFPIFNLQDEEIEIGNPGVVPTNRFGGTLLDDEFSGLKISDVTNFDLRYEVYGEGTNFFAISFFHKQIENPIERITSVDFGNSQVFTYINNSTTALVRGIELELTRGLGFFGERFNAFTLGSNFTYISAETGRSPQEIQLYRNLADDVGTSRRLFDQPEYIFNAFLNYLNPSWGTDVTLSYNLVSDELYATGNVDRPDLYEDAFGTLDLVISQKFGDGWKVGLKVKNITDEERKIVVDESIVDQADSQDLEIYTDSENYYDRYTSGRSVSLSVTKSF